MRLSITRGAAHCLIISGAVHWWPVWPSPPPTGPSIAAPQLATRPRPWPAWWCMAVAGNRAHGGGLLLAVSIAKGEQPFAGLTIKGKHLPAELVIKGEHLFANAGAAGEEAAAASQWRRGGSSNNKSSRVYGVCSRGRGSKHWRREGSNSRRIS